MKKNLKNLWDLINLKNNIISNLIKALEIGIIVAIIIYFLYTSNALNIANALIYNYPNK